MYSGTNIKFCDATSRSGTLIINIYTYKFTYLKVYINELKTPILHNIIPDYNYEKIG